MPVTTNSGVPLNGLTPVWQNGSPYNAANNQLLSASYDAAGNQTGMGSLASSFDAEGRLTRTYDTTAQIGVTYQYDAHGQRELKTVDGQAPTVYVRDALGHLAAEYGSENTAPCTTCYLSYDHLGSVRVVTVQSANVVSRHEYIPFGEEIPGGWVGRTGSGWDAADSLHQRFTGQERDGETGLDYFNARYYGSILGRFTSPDPDPGSMEVTNPQSFNRYAYVWNNPLANTDPTGADICINGSYADVCVSATPDPVPVETSSWLGGLGGIPTFSVTHSEAWAPTPRQQQPGNNGTNSNCVAGYGAAGAAAGAGVGWLGGGGAAVLGAETGPFDIVIAYGGKVLSGAVGTYVGQQAGKLIGSIVCSSSTGSGGGGGGGAAPNKPSPRDPNFRRMTVREILARYIRASVRSEFPAGYNDMTFEQVDRLAGQGNGEAQTVRKLLTDSRFWK